MVEIGVAPYQGSFCGVIWWSPAELILNPTWANRHSDVFIANLLLTAVQVADKIMFNFFSILADIRDKY